MSMFCVNQNFDTNVDFVDIVCYSVLNVHVYCTQKGVMRNLMKRDVVVSNYMYN